MTNNNSGLHDTKGDFLEAHVIIIPIVVSAMLSMYITYINQ